MKRYTYIYIIMASAISLAGCHDEENADVLADRHPIQVSLSDIGAITRAYTPNTIQELQKGHVHFWMQTEYVEDGVNVWDECEIVWNGNLSQFETLPVLYWPRNNDTKVSIAVITEEGQMNGFSGINFGVAHVPVSDSSVSDTFFDGLAAYVEQSERESDHGRIYLDFEHIKSAVNVKLVASAEDNYSIHDVYLIGESPSSYNVATSSWNFSSSLHVPLTYTFYETLPTVANYLRLQSGGTHEIEGEVLVVPGTYTLYVYYSSAPVDGAYGPDAVAPQYKTQTVVFKAGEQKTVNVNLSPVDQIMN